MYSQKCSIPCKNVYISYFCMYRFSGVEMEELTNLQFISDVFKQLLQLYLCDIRSGLYEQRLHMAELQMPIHPHPKERQETYDPHPEKAVKFAETASNGRRDLVACTLDIITSEVETVFVCIEVVVTLEGRSGPSS